MYKTLRALLEKGYEVSFRPDKKDQVRLTVQEAKQGTVNGVRVDMINMEWRLAEVGIEARLKEALETLTR